MGCEGIRGRTGARAWEVIHIYTGSFTPSPDPTPFYRRLISTRKGGLTTNGIHLLIPASLSNRSGPPHLPGRQAERLAKGKGARREAGSEGSREQKRWPDEQELHRRQPRGMRGRKTRSPVPLRNARK